MDNKQSLEMEARMRPGVELVYRNRQGEIIVYWESKICNHTGKCFRGLPRGIPAKNPILGFSGCRLDDS